MLILHTSDIHGQTGIIVDALSDPCYDVWIDTGDFFPNQTRGLRSVETRYQTAWFAPEVEAIVKALNGRPLVSVGGNHDYVSLADLVTIAGGTGHDLSNGAVSINGKTFAGFREVPIMMGEWNGETYAPDFDGIVDAAMASDPDVLVTHAPPAGILDDQAHGGGVGQIANALTWHPHKVTTHFFGHIHEAQGSVTEMGIRFINGAGKAIFHTLPSV